MKLKTILIIGLAAMTCATSVSARARKKKPTMAEVPQNPYKPVDGKTFSFVFGVTVLLSGDAALFMSYSVIGTVITVIVKGTVAGACAGWIYRLFESKNKWIAAITASAIAPVVNTGIFFIGSAVFFFNDLTAFASTVGYDSFVSVMFGYMIGFNFIAEFAFNLIVTPVIYRVIDLGVGMADKKATERH